MKAAVVYWSGTGNTEAMASAVLEGMTSAGAEAKLYTAAEFGADLLDGLEAIAFGCPAMGSEQLEETEFEPMWDSIKDKLGGKKISLFGSYSWAEGEWMENWKNDAAASGIELSYEPIICYEAPDADMLSRLSEMGRSLASA